MSRVDERPAVIGGYRSQGLGRLARVLWAVTRLSLAFVFLWAFLDKAFGLGRSTPSDRAWLRGGSPTRGFIGGIEGPFANFFGSMGGAVWADWLFMLGLLGIGLALLLGIGMWVAAVSGALLLFFMWMASLPIASNPFMDDHLVYGLVLLGLAASRAGDTWGLGCQWARTSLVQRFPVLR